MVMMMVMMMVRMMAMRKRRGNQRQRSATTNGSLESQNCSYCGRLNTTSLSWCNGKYKYKDKWRQKIFFKQQCSALTSGDSSIMFVLLFVHFFQLFPCKKLLKLFAFQGNEEKQMTNNNGPFLWGSWFMLYLCFIYIAIFCEKLHKKIMLQIGISCIVYDW